MVVTEGERQLLVYGQTFSGGGGGGWGGGSSERCLKWGGGGHQGIFPKTSQIRGWVKTKVVRRAGRGV